MEPAHASRTKVVLGQQDRHKRTTTYRVTSTRGKGKKVSLRMRCSAVTTRVTVAVWDENFTQQESFVYSSKMSLCEKVRFCRGHHQRIIENRLRCLSLTSSFTAKNVTSRRHVSCPSRTAVSAAVVTSTAIGAILTPRTTREPRRTG